MSSPCASIWGSFSLQEGALLWFTTQHHHCWTRCPSAGSRLLELLTQELVLVQRWTGVIIGCWSHRRWWSRRNRPSQICSTLHFCIESVSAGSRCPNPDSWDLNRIKTSLGTTQVLYLHFKCSTVIIYLWDPPCFPLIPQAPEESWKIC